MPTLSWTELMKGGANPSLFALLSFSDSNKKRTHLLHVDGKNFSVGKTQAATF